MPALEQGQILAIDKPPHQRSKVPLKSIEILDVDDLGSKIEMSTAATAEKMDIDDDNKSMEFTYFTQLYFDTSPGL